MGQDDTPDNYGYGYGSGNDKPELADLSECFDHAFPELDESVEQDHIDAFDTPEPEEHGDAHVHGDTEDALPASGYGLGAHPGFDEAPDDLEEPDAHDYGQHAQKPVEPVLPDAGNDDGPPAGNTPNDHGVSEPIQSKPTQKPGGTDRSWQAPLAVYDFYGAHRRHKPIKSDFTGHVRTVRVRLRARREAPIYIRKWRNIHQLDVYAMPEDQRYAKVSHSGKIFDFDEVLFSVESVKGLYRSLFPAKAAVADAVQRVDLITAARLRRGKGRRFSPVSIFLAYADADLSSAPLFYFLGGADILGSPRVLYCGDDMGPIYGVGGFPYTNLACSSNFYTGLIEMENNVDPKTVNLVIFRRGDTQRASHLNVWIDIRRKDPRSLTRWVLSPLDRQLEAAKRIHTIAQGMNCTFKNPAIQEALGNNGRLLDWTDAPKQRGGEVKAGYSGCKKKGD